MWARAATPAVLSPSNVIVRQIKMILDRVDPTS
jgi:hypothetical protein